MGEIGSEMLKKVLLGGMLTLILVVGVGIAVVKYYQYQNLQLLFEDKLDGRLIAHKVNQQGKLEAILNSGIRSFELDVLFRKQGESGYFEIGHDEHEVRGQTFESYLTYLQTYSINKIWMDVKNVGDDNAEAMLVHLENLAQKYGVKPSILLESSTTSPQLKIFSDAGFHTSYYLPTNAILNLLARQKPDDLAQEAIRIRDLVLVQDVSAISFPASLYPFVKQYVEPLLPKNIVYHTWNIIKLEDNHALEKLKDTPVFKDPRVRTIIYSYHYIS